MQLSGAVTPMVTPVADNSSTVDTDTLASFTTFLVDRGSHVLFPCGSLGEFSSLTREERSAVIETVAEHAGDTPVLAGCGGTSIGEVRRLIEDADAAGVDAAVIVTPYYLTGRDDGLLDFYRRLIEYSPLPIILYNIPSLTDTHIAVDTVVELANDDDVIGIKDSTGDILYHQRLVESTPDSFSVLQGMAEHAISSLDMGADGFVAGPANVYPGMVSAIYEAYRRGDRSEAIDLWRDISNPIVTATKPLPTASGLKYLLRCTGRDVGGPLPPLSKPSQQDQERLIECHRQVHRQSQSMEAQSE